MPATKSLTASVTTETQAASRWLVLSPVVANFLQATSIFPGFPRFSAGLTA
jgi:hypothetical protein